MRLHRHRWVDRPGRWQEAESELPRMDRLGEKGAAFASALAAAIREEIDRARGGPKPQHEALSKLGYNWVTELLSYRVHQPGSPR